MGTPSVTPMSTEAKTVNLDAVSELMGEALRNVRAIDGIRVPAGNNPTRQQARRDLMYVADVLDRAAAEAKAAYWELSDRPDPLS